MTKARIPGTWSHAAAAIGDHLGAKRAAAIAGVGLRTFYHWSDPDAGTAPSIAQAAALDLAFADAGGGGMPFLAVYQQVAAQHGAVVDPCRDGLVDDVAMAAREFGEAAEHALAAARPSATPGQVLRAMNEAEELKTAADSMARRLGALFRRGAGPRHHAGGTQ